MLSRLKKINYKELLNNDLFIETFLLLLIFFVYIHHISASAYGGDSGDLIAAAMTAGVPHPSGYPIYTFLGFIFTKLPFIHTPAWKVGLLSTVFASLGIVIFYKINLQLIKDKYVSFVASLTLAFTYTFWLYAVHAEVFSLHIMLILLLSYTVLRYIKTKNNKYVYLTAFLAGLSLSNNQTIVLMFPGIVLTMLLVNKRLILNIKLILKSFVLAVLGLLPYLYIYLAALREPIINWGKANNLENLLFLVTRRHYGWVPESGFIERPDSSRFINYYDYWRIYIPIIVIAFIVLGVIYLIRNRNYIWLFFIFSTFAILGPFFVFYTRDPFTNFLLMATMEKFYLSGIVIIFLLLAPGFQLLINSVKYLMNNRKLKTAIYKVSLTVLVIIPVSSFLLNYLKTDLGNVKIGDTFGIDILNSLPQDAMFIVMGDTAAFNTIYVQLAYDHRKDVKIPGIQNGFESYMRAAGFSDTETENYNLKYKNHIQKEEFLNNFDEVVKTQTVYVDKPVQYKPEDRDDTIVSLPRGIVYSVHFNNELILDENYIDYLKDKTFSLHVNALKEDSVLLQNNLMLADISKYYSLVLYDTGIFLNESGMDRELATLYLINSALIDPIITQEIVD